MVLTDDFPGLDFICPGLKPFVAVVGVRRILLKRYEDVENALRCAVVRGRIPSGATCARPRVRPRRRKSDMAWIVGLKSV